MDNEDMRIRYALSKQVPDLERGAVFETAYGELRLEGDDARQVAALVRRLLEHKLRGAETDKSVYMPVCNVPEIDPALRPKIRQQIEDSVRAGHDYETFNAAIKRLYDEHAATTAGRAG